MSPGIRPSHGTFPEKLETGSKNPPRSIITSPTPRRIFPKSATMGVLERQCSLPSGRRRRREPEMSIGRRRGLAAGRRADEKADLEEEGLHPLRERLAFVIDGGGDGLQPHRATAVLLDDRL